MSTLPPAAPAKSEQVTALEALIAAGLTLSDCIAAFSDRQGEAEQFFIDLARDQWVREGQIEIDDKTIVSGSDDHGDYVLAWVWVSDPRPNPEDEEDGDDTTA